MSAEIKPLSALGVSPAPWEICDFCKDHIGVAAKTGRRVADVATTETAALVAAAPEIYECLREAVALACARCMVANQCNGCSGGCRGPAVKWIAALRKAAGMREKGDVKKEEKLWDATGTSAPNAAVPTAI